MHIAYNLCNSGDKYHFKRQRGHHNAAKTVARWRHSSRHFQREAPQQVGDEEEELHLG